MKSIKGKNGKIVATRLTKIIGDLNKKKIKTSSDDVLRIMRVLADPDVNDDVYKIVSTYNEKIWTPNKIDGLFHMFKLKTETKIPVDPHRIRVGIETEGRRFISTIDVDDVAEMFGDGKLREAVKNIIAKYNLKEGSINEIIFVNGEELVEKIGAEAVFTRKYSREIAEKRQILLPIFKKEEKSYDEIKNRIIKYLLPHEAGHAKVYERFGELGGDLIEFEEYLVERMCYEKFGNDFLNK
ncbi:MAG: hypothetical protein QW112_01625, partial [Candidatus Micrarchaeia archaeon]